jgi:phosphatidate phosphatase APP1
VHFVVHKAKKLSFLALWTTTKSYKIGAARKIIQFFDNRKFIMIGDSTQSDAEVYTQMALEFPEKLVCIFIIRISEGVNREKEMVLNAAARYQAIFAEVPEEKWMLFREPDELPSADMIKRGICRH